MNARESPSQIPDTIRTELRRFNQPVAKHAYFDVER